MILKFWMLRLLYTQQCSFDFQDKPGKHLARVPAYPPTQQISPAIENTNGELTRDTQEKLQIFADFYSLLYASEGHQYSEGAFLQILDFLPQLTEEHRVALEANITVAEIGNAIYHLKPNKSPGLDGLTSEFYKNFKIVLLPHLQKLLAGCLRDQELPESWKQAKLIL